ncbi:sugar-specific transcriptional regulator TrmB [Halobacterium salinarum]|uniref:winged helix-turn-helix domain-containing protein n=1 Tax=Halobacterium salinarum TaxID=2242 RepID=UPI0025542C55|nr:sugar-specific transcriptional regulator TrmB [Halobacterium salinarum]MDL0118507.1 sugar-specific transcriptional regulator TrmB [Halobacterium salinarum]MDL0118720.1 sugar-specific transcriptional regulator TrmB [Halobacterium salinarum]MDL0118768.1 sugar-specific transcriptional regulator TrmB [Halobacterium salinarum]
MSEFDPVPQDDSGDSRQRWMAESDTFDRVYDVVLGVSTPTPYGEIAERADCSANAAKKHLDRLAEMGVVRKDEQSRPARYERDDGYLEWQEASRIARELSVEEIIDRVADLEAERDAYEQRFETTDPESVTVFEVDDHEAVHERMDAVSDWQATTRDLRLYELARQLAQNDGHLIPA